MGSIKLIEDALKQYFNKNDDLEVIRNINDDGVGFICKSKITGEIIVFNFVMTNFGSKELAEYTVLCEDLYEEFDVKVNVFLILDSDKEVTVEEFEINSVADFSISVAIVDIHETVLDIIKIKLNIGMKLGEEDIRMLKLLPVYCDKSRRLYYREECFKILNSLGL